MFTLTLGDYTKTYILLKTNAPKSYDFGNVIPIQEYTHEDKTTRWVLIPKDSVGNQQSRYLSGIFTSEIADELSPGMIGDILFKRLTQKEN